MRSGERPGRARRRGHPLVFAALCCAALHAVAIDNPDLPDLVGAFVARDERARTAIDQSPTQAASLAAYADYERFLQGELTAALAALREQLGDDERRRLDAAQSRWVAWRDAESRFITGTWRRDAFGSSAGLSRGAYRCTVLRDRVRALLQYRKDQPSR